MRGSDTRAIAELSSHYFPLARIDEGEVRRRVSKGFVYFVAELKGKPVGFVDVKVRERSVYICGIAVDPRYEGRGIGSALLERAGKLAGSRGRPALMLTVKEGNAKALKFYMRHGFSVKARRSGREGNVLLLQRALD
jgi:ribosomal protein S18 acetylase RimI-like enzyme